ncbi:MAG: glucose-6-phosphate isomerase [Proteobacteria bacterium]|nr:glucose-6-phosphate isomerase [Pseudomonadota bacterium]
MNKITLDITNVLSKTIGKEGLDTQAITGILSKLEVYNKTLWDAPYPFMELPSKRFQFKEMKRLADNIKTKNIKNLVLLGIGGSSLGTETIFNALLHPFHNLSEGLRNGKPRYFILDNIDPHKINRIIDMIKKEKENTLLIVISKSGETPETTSQFMIFEEILSKKPNFRDRVVIITDKKKGILKEIVDREEYPVLNVPEGVGGRFSVLTPVGLFPSIAMGINIDEIADGANSMAIHVKKAVPQKNMAIMIASILYLMDKKGKGIHVIMPYCERLSGFADWFRQLEGESLGKNNLGATPLKSIGVTDQHSQLQLYIDGPKNKCIMFLYSANEKRVIPKSFPYIEALDYLAGKDLKDLFHAEFLGTSLSLTEVKTPNFSLLLNEINGYNLGALFFLYEMVITFLGYLYSINPFDQPGVELGKIYTKAIMGKKGFETKRIAAEARLSTQKTVITF